MMDNRTRILECALQLFSARGYDAVGIQEIVETAGVTKPTLYHYFNSKRGLLDTLLESEFEGFKETLQQAAADPHNLPMTLEKVILVYFELASRRPQFYRLRLGMVFAPPDSEPNQAVMHYLHEQFAVVEALFGQALSHMSRRRQAYAASFIGMIDTYIGLYLNQEAELSSELVHQAAHQFMHGIYS